MTSIFGYWSFLEFLRAIWGLLFSFFIYLVCASPFLSLSPHFILSIWFACHTSHVFPVLFGVHLAITEAFGTGFGLVFEPDFLCFILCFYYFFPSFFPGCWFQEFGVTSWSVQMFLDFLPAASGVSIHTSLNSCHVLFFLSLLGLSQVLCVWYLAGYCLFLSHVLSSLDLAF